MAKATKKTPAPKAPKAPKPAAIKKAATPKKEKAKKDKASVKKTGKAAPVLTKKVSEKADTSALLKAASSKPLSA